jgi:hypothetical protein
MAGDIDNLKIQQQINAAIAERGRLLSSQTALIADQVELAASFCKAMKCEGIDEISDRISELRSGLEAAGGAAERASRGVGDIRGGLDDAAGGAGGLSDAIDAAESSTGGFGKAMSGAMAAMSGGWGKIVNLLSGVPSLLGSILEGAINIGKSIFQFGLSLKDALFDAAAELAGNTAMADAREEVREQYGDLGTGIAKQIIDSQSNVSAAVSKAGLSVGKVFGTGPGGTAKMLLDTLELAKSLGPAVNLLGSDFSKMAGTLVVFQRGLGLTGEELKSVIVSAKAMGQDVEKVLEETAKISTEMVNKFGGSAKEYAKDIAYMKSQSASFGKMTTAQMAAASVSVRKYGMELKDIVGIGKAFEDFEGAAEKSAQLSQMFGAFVDPIKMMKEEDPAKQFEMLRNSMKQAGQSAETMNKAQIKALASTTGMDENMVRLAFSSKNAGKSLGEIQKASENAGKKQKSQAEIMQEMGDNIKRLVESLSGKIKGGFMDTFLSGIKEGVMRSKPFKEAVHAISRALTQVFYIGKEVGDFFMNNFPGISDIFGSMGDYAKSAAEKFKFFGRLLKDLFVGLRTDPTKAMEQFNKKILDFIDGMFKPGGSTGWIGRLMKGVKDFSKAIASILGGMIKLLGELVQKGATELVAWLKKPKQLAPNGAEAKSFVEELIEPIWDSMKVAVPKIFTSLVKVIEASIGAIIPAILNAGTKLLQGAFTKLGQVSIASFGASLTQNNKNQIGTFLLRTASDLGAGPYMSKIGQKIGGKVLGRAIGAALSGPGSLAISAAVSASRVDEVVGKSMDEKLKSGKIKNVGASGGGMIAATVVDAFTLGLLSDDTIIKIADSAANLLDTLLEGIRKFAPNYADALSNNLMGLFKVFAGVGDIIIGLFTADEQKIKAGLEKAVKGIGYILLGLWKTALSLLGELLPFLLDVFAKLFKGLAKGIGALIRVVAVALYDSLVALVKGIYLFLTDAKFRQEAIVAISDALGGVVDGLKDSLGKLFTSLFGAIYDISIGFVQGLFGDELFKQMFGELPNMSGKEIFEEIFGGFGDFMSFTWNNMKNAGVEIMNGLIEGIKSLGGKLADAMVGPLKDGWQAAKDFFGIRSPSVEAAKMGEQIVAGMDKGLEEMPTVTGDKSSEAVDAMQKSVDAIDPAAMGKAAESLKAFKEIANAVGGIGDTKGLDAITNLITAMGSMFSNIPLGSDADVERAPKAIAAIVGGMDTLLQSVGNKLATVIPQMRTALGGITGADIEMLRPRVEFVGSLLEMIGKFANVVKDNQLSPDQIAAIEAAKTSATGPIPDGFDDMLKKFGTFIAGLNAEGGLITQLKGLSFDETVTKAMGFVDNVLSISTKFHEVYTTLVGAKDIFAQDLPDIFGKLWLLNQQAQTFLSGGGIANLGSTLGTLEKLGTTVSSFKTKYGEGVATYLNAAVSDMQELDRILEKIEINDLDTTIDNMNGKLIVKRQNFEFSHKPVHVTINMKVSFNAENFTKDIFKVAGQMVKADPNNLSGIEDLSNPDKMKAYNSR